MTDEGIFLRTVIKKSVDTRLKELSKRYSTGRGHWDIGVAIELLLDFWDYNHDTNNINQKMDMIMNVLMQPQQQEEAPIEETGIDMLGGERLK